MIRFIVLPAFSVLVLFLVGCASTPPLAPIAVSPATAKANQVLAVDNLLVVVDTSGSLGPKSSFPVTKQVVEGFVAALPQGDYQAGILSFGGQALSAASLSSFNRSALANTAANIRHGGGLSPI
ncbi:VWA domain-containing protein, partial [Myxococcota bacterium]|nr:VWA domain-containing protein [Myxococcota bacterium]